MLVDVRRRTQSMPNVGRDILRGLETNQEKKHTVNVETLLASDHISSAFQSFEAVIKKINAWPYLRGIRQPV